MMRDLYHHEALMPRTINERIAEAPKPGYTRARASPAARRAGSAGS